MKLLKHASKSLFFYSTCKLLFLVSSFHINYEHLYLCNVDPNMLLISLTLPIKYMKIELVSWLVVMIFYWLCLCNHAFVVFGLCLNDQKSLMLHFKNNLTSWEQADRSSSRPNSWNASDDSWPTTISGWCKYISSRTWMV